MEGDMDMDMGDGGHMNHSSPVSFQINVTFVMFLHLATLFVAFGLIYPYSFAAKQARLTQRHLILQLVGAALAVVGFITGHFTGVDGYNSWYADIGCIYCWAITGGSLLLLIYVPRGVLSHLRRAINIVHTAASVIQPLICWVTTGLSIITLLGYCSSEGEHTGQCLAHGIMGTAFITYGVILLVMMYFGQNFLRRMNRSQEYFDSVVITIWGIINTFTEHRWGQDWNHGDVQHTSMGVVWWAMGSLGIYMSWDRVNNKPQRTHIPALIILATGYAMLTHTQHLPVSTNIHFMFGMALSLAALARIIEISFVLKDGPVVGQDPVSWQFLTPMFMIESGMLFMSATEEAMEFLDDQSIMAPPYVLVITSVAAIVFLGALYVVQSYMSMRQNNEVAFSKERASEDIEMPFLTRARDAEVQPQDFELSD